MTFVLFCGGIARENVIFPGKKLLHSVMGILFLTLRMFYSFKSKSHWKQNVIFWYVINGNT